MKKKEESVITASEMKELIFKKGYIPNPLYTEENESGHLIPRGTIFWKKRDRFWK